LAVDGAARQPGQVWKEAAVTGTDRVIVQPSTSSKKHFFFWMVFLLL